MFVRGIPFQKKISIAASLLFTLCASAHVGADEFANRLSLKGLPSPYSFSRFCALHASELWMVGGGGQILHWSGENVRRLRTSTKADLAGVKFINPSVGWIVGDGGTILHTEDGGLQWSLQTSKINDALEAIDCINEQTCWAVGDNGKMLRTVNGGRRWKVVETQSSENFYAVDFIDKYNGWVAGADGIVLNTQDGGTTWTRQQVAIIVFPDGPFARTTNLRSINFINCLVGFAAGTGGIARTSDGGRTWQATSIEEGSFIGIVTQDGTNVWAVNGDGPNYSSQDSGSTWKECP
jgi:photosystem II stability/assembly factor-like uncharacterized protein